MPYNKIFEIKSYSLDLGKKIAQTRYSITLSIAVLLTVLALALPALAQAAQASTPESSAPKTQLNHGPAGQPLVSTLSVASGQKYQVVEDGLTSGAMVYIDRSYTFTSIPSALIGATYIKTANNDKNRNQQNFLTLSVDQDVTVYVAYDQRATALPSWLSGWTNTEQRLGTTDVGRKLFSRDFPAGTIILGGNMAAGAAGARSNYSVIIVGRGSTTPGNEAPNVDAGLNQSVTMSSPATAFLNGVVDDDGFPNPPGLVNTQWSLVSGPASVAFADASAVTTTATFVEAGVYVLELAAHDGEMDGDDTLTITVHPANQAPQVDAGSDAVISLSQGAALTGSVTDDGLPNPPGAVTTLWSKLSGPGSVTFADAGTLETVVTFAAEGTYVLRLTGDDSQLTASDDVIVNVELPTPTNEAPQVDAGDDQAITLPGGAALDGSVADDGLPNPPGSVAILWNKVTGPGSVTFADPSSVDTSADFTEAGIYVLNLSADDGQFTTSHQVTITVNAKAPTAEFQVSILSIASGQPYEVMKDGLNSGAMVFIDRSYTFTSVPSALMGATYIKTANNDKNRTQQNFLTLSVNQDAMVYVAYDQRATALPNWLSGWTNTGARLGTTDVGRHLFSRDFPAGTITLGGNMAAGAAGASTNYNVVLVGQGGSTPPPPEQNQRPVVNAGPDITITLPNNAALNATVNDDGLPNPPGVMSTQWTKVSGPGSVNFANAGAIDTTAGFSSAGTYVLRLTASDSELTTSDDVTITAVTAPTPGGTITLSPGIRYQTMKGWEGTAQMGHTFAGNFNLFKDELVDRLVNELGINRVRLESHQTHHAAESSNDNPDPFSINWNGFDFTNFDVDVERVVIPIRQAMAANGEQLYVNFNTVAVGTNNDAFHQDPDEFAEFVLAHFLHLQSKYGFVPDAVEVSLEPDVFKTFNQDPRLLGAALVATGDRLSAHGFTPDFIGPSNTNTSNANSWFDSMIQVPGVLNYLTEFSYHRYSAPSGTVGNIGNKSRAHGIGAAMLEHIGADVNELYEDLTSGNNVAWQQFTLAFPTSDNGAQYYVIDNSNPSDPQVNMGSRTKLLRQYFKFIRSGAQRIGASSANGSFNPVAFINPDGKYVVVVKASGGGSFSVAGLPTGRYGIKYTTGSQYDVDLADVMLGSGGVLNASIPASGVVTVYGK